MGFGDVNRYVIQVFLGRGKSAVAHVFVDDLRIDAALELVGDKGVPKIVDFGGFDPGFSKIPVDGGSNVSNQKRPAGFGDEEMNIGDLGAKG